MSDQIREISWLGYRLRAMRYRWLRYVSRPTHVIARTRFFDLRFKAITNDRHGRLLTKHGAHEDLLTLALLDAIQDRPGTLMLDIGANLGWYSCVIGRAHPGLNVLAFEPDPVTHELLLDNLRLNGLRNVTPIPCAVSNQAGTARFYQFTGGNRGENSLLPTNADESTSVTVPTVVLDEELAARGLDAEPIRLIKLDIEGHEHEALKGAPRALQRCQCLLMEYSPKFFAQLGYKGEALLDLLYAAGLRAHVVAQRELLPVTREQLLAEPKQINTIWLR